MDGYSCLTGLAPRYREQEIIRHKSSCFVLGRSGTGYVCGGHSHISVSDVVLQENHYNALQDVQH